MEDYDKKAAQIWDSVLKSADNIAAQEPFLKDLVNDTILSRANLFDSVRARISRKLGRNAVDEKSVFKIFGQAFDDDYALRKNIVMDIEAVVSRDPACAEYVNPVLYLKGFHSITTHRVSHWLWLKGHAHMAYYLQSLSSEIFGVDIHPAARFGGGIMLDHATSFVAGETSVVEDNVSILHEVTLGGTGNETGDRHPKVMSDVLIGAGAKLIGNILIGKGAKIGAGSVVLDDVPAHTTVAGVPAKPIHATRESNPASEMNQKL